MDASSGKHNDTCPKRRSFVCTRRDRSVLTFHQEVLLLSFNTSYLLCLVIKKSKIIFNNHLSRVVVENKQSSQNIQLKTRSRVMEKELLKFDEIQLQLEFLDIGETREREDTEKKF